MTQRTDKQGARRAQPRRPDPAARRERWARTRRALRITGIVLGVAGGAGGTAWGVAWVLSPAAFPLESVHFDNRLERVQQADLRRALDGHLDAGFWGLDLGAIRAALEGLPWVEAAAVRRVWPGELRVGIREQQAVAVWNEEALIGASGEVFAPDAQTWPEGLPELAGPEGRHDDVRTRYQELATALEAVGFQVQGVAMDARGSWSAELDGGAELRLGRDNLEARLQRFVRGYPVARERRDAELARADLRYPNGFSARWRDDGDQAPN
ncbi:MAG: cell division protein FtsQ/DivIB [Ectothiorhodospiraceae bacterium]